MKPLTVYESQEWQSAADWCAVRHLDGSTGCRLPALLSRRVVLEIADYPEEFKQAIRDAQYERAQRKAR